MTPYTHEGETVTGDRTGRTAELTLRRSTCAIFTEEKVISAIPRRGQRTPHGSAAGILERRPRGLWQYYMGKYKVCCPAQPEKSAGCCPAAAKGRGGSPEISRTPTGSNLIPVHALGQKPSPLQGLMISRCWLCATLWPPFSCLGRLPFSAISFSEEHPPCYRESSVQPYPLAVQFCGKAAH